MKITAHVESLAQGLDYHAARQNVLASNLANVDTPGYRAKDLARIDAFEGELQTAMAQTDAAHMGTPAGGLDVRIETDDATPAGADGNNVSLDREVVKISTNHVRYETVSTLVSHELSTLLWAATDGRSG